MTIANTILQQLGNSRFIAMTGAKNLGGTGRGLSMKCGGGKFVVITLDANDTYTVEVFKLRACQRTGEVVRSGVYVDKLRATFTELTGLSVSL